MKHLGGLNTYDLTSIVHVILTTAAVGCCPEWNSVNRVCVKQQSSDKHVVMIS